MATTNVLGIALLDQSQNDKYLTANNATSALANAIAAVTPQAMADADQTPDTATAMQTAVFQCTGALTADRKLILPNAKKVYIIHNLTTGGHNILVETASPGAVATIPMAEPIFSGSPAIIIGVTGAQFIYCDGSNNFYGVE